MHLFPVVQITLQLPVFLLLLQADIQALLQRLLCLLAKSNKNERGWGKSEANAGFSRGRTTKHLLQLFHLQRVLRFQLSHLSQEMVPLLLDATHLLLHLGVPFLQATPFHSQGTASGFSFSELFSERSAHLSFPLPELLLCSRATQSNTHTHGNRTSMFTHT